ncbi:MAG: lipopolysaccharide transport periplasmic protein LptA [Pseudomonadota bacterium]
MISKGFVLLLIGVVEVAFLSLCANAESVTRKGLTQDSVIHISSDKMEADNKEKWVEFSGNVVATQETTRIEARRMRLFYVDKKQKESDSIDKIIAEENVKITIEGKIASADHAEYTTAGHMLVLIGNAKAWSGENIVTGNKITLYLNEDRSLVEGGATQQVEAILHPNKDNGGGLLK